MVNLVACVRALFIIVRNNARQRMRPDRFRNTPSAKLLRVAIMGIHRIGQETILFLHPAKMVIAMY
jgi:NO-binding membrane sensor protein with MHYT domain